MIALTDLNPNKPLALSLFRTTSKVHNNYSHDHDDQADDDDNQDDDE